MMRNVQNAIPMRRWWTFSIVLIAAAVLAVYGLSLGNDFVYWDDPILILENPTVTGVTWRNIVRAFTTYDPELYIPLTLLTYQINYAVAGLQPFFYHLSNVLLHLGSALLVLWVLWLLLRKPWVALLTALLFAVHPLHVETVAWASARKDVLSSFFFLLSLGSFLRWRGAHAGRWYAVALLAFLFGLLSKVSILVLPVVLLLIDWRERRSLVKRETILPVLPFLGLSVIFGIVALFGKVQSSHHLWEKLLIGMRAIVVTLAHHIIPLGYSVLYPYTDAIRVTNPDLLVSLLIVLGLCAAAVFLRNRFRNAAFCFWFFLVLMLPSFLTIEKGGDLVRDVYVTSDRYAYLASIGVLLGIALLFELVRRRTEKAGMALGAIAVLLLLPLAAAQARVWRNTETLFTHVLRWYPDSYAAYNNLGAHYDLIGDAQRAEDAYRKSIAVHESGHAWFNVGQIEFRKGNVAAAIAAYRRSVELRPFHATAQLNLGALLLDAGKPQEALEHLLKGQSLAPENLAAYLNLGLALERLGNTHDARRAYERALIVDPTNAVALRKLKELTR